MADEGLSNSVRGMEEGIHEPQVQHEPNATERLAILMAQYMEHQLARSVRGTALHEQFMKLNLLQFMGAANPLVAEEWLKKLAIIFEVMEVIEE